LLVQSKNDNRGINVKRGLRNKCNIGIRPGVAPIGYLNTLKGNRIASVEFDPARAAIIKEMFHKVANQGYSGRMIKRWLDQQGFMTKNNCKMTLGRIYATLNNPFYYGEFKYGVKWYKGTHQPLVTKYIFDKAQVQMQVAPRQWNKQVFPFKKLCKCGRCGGSVTAEVKYRRTKANKINTHIYYHCNRIRDYDCTEPYITEIELIRQLILFVPQLKLNTKYLWAEFNEEIKRLNHLKGIIAYNENSNINDINLTPHQTKVIKDDELTKQELDMLRQYLLHILKFGTPEERLKILTGINSKFELKDSQLRLV